MLFGRSQNTLKAHHEQITEQVGMNVLRAAAHVILLKATDSFADCGFKFTLRLHVDSERTHQVRGAGTGPHVVTQYEPSNPQ